MGAKKSNKKITLEDLILRKTQGDLDKIKVSFYNSAELGGELEIRKIPLKDYMSLLNGLETANAEDSLDFMGQLIYKCCPLFNQNSKELMDTYGCSVATDLPIIILNENLGEINEIINIINSFYGLDELQEKVKN